MSIGESQEIQRFGEKLHRLRTQRGLTLKALAEELGYNTHTYISELEHGKKLPTAKLVLQVARYFDVTTDELLKDELYVSVSGISRSECHCR